MRISLLNYFQILSADNLRLIEGKAIWTIPNRAQGLLLVLYLGTAPSSSLGTSQCQESNPVIFHVQHALQWTELFLQTVLNCMWCNQYSFSCISCIFSHNIWYWNTSLKFRSTQFCTNVVLLSSSNPSSFPKLMMKKKGYMTIVTTLYHGKIILFFSFHSFSNNIFI